MLSGASITLGDRPDGPHQPTEDASNGASMSQKSLIGSLAIGALSLLCRLVGAGAEDHAKFACCLPMTGPCNPPGLSDCRRRSPLHGRARRHRGWPESRRLPAMTPRYRKPPSGWRKSSSSRTRSISCGFRPHADRSAVAPLATEARIPEIVMAAGTLSITERSPYILCTSFTLPQSSVIMAEWIAEE